MNILVFIIPPAIIIMSFVIFKILKPYSKLKSSHTPIEGDGLPDTGNVLKGSEDLIKQASELKGRDINHAILLIEEAIKISSTRNMQYYFKLANYCHYSGRIDKAYSIYNDLISDLDMQDIVTFNHDKAEVLEKICILNYKNGEYENYLFNYSYCLFNNVMGVACQGKISELKEMINNKNKLSYFSTSKISGCFKKLNMEGSQKQFNTSLNTFFLSMQEDLFVISKTSKSTQNAIKKRLSGRSFDNTALNSLLNQNKEFTEVYTKLNSEKFEEFYKVNILMSGDQD